jgi:3-oxoacyl-[acyl-carrier-protein] synthase II
LSFSRVAITGLGAVSALGFGAAATFQRLCTGERGIGPLSLFDPLDARARVVGEVRGLDLSAIVPGGDASYSRTDAMALVAAREALEQAGRHGRLGVAVGGTTGGMLEAETALLGGSSSEPFQPERARRLLDHPLDRTATHLASVLGALRHSTVCAACASGAVAIARATAWLERGEVDQALAGGADGLCRLTFFGFDSLGALDPGPCRPFDRARRGLNLGEGAGFLLLEREETARARGAEILGFLAGASIGAEAHHITHPEPSGAPAAELIRRSLRSARLDLGEVRYVNAHGTGTPQNDSMEARALHAAFGESTARVLVSSSKGQLGHTLGAAGALEAVVTVLSVARGVAPPTVGLEDPEDTTLRHVVGKAVASNIDVALSCSFGFGGTGCVLAFERADAPSRDSTGRAAAFGKRALVTGTALLGPGNMLEALDPERSRRFDRAAAGVTFATRAALEDAGLDATRAGLVAGSAYGNVERSVDFVRRILEKGVRRAHPAEFPHLVASASPGNASLYLGLRGPVLGVAGAEASGEAALDTALALLPFVDGGLVAGAAEALDPIVMAVLGPLRTATRSVPRGEGGGFLVVEDAEAAMERGARIAALVEPPRWLPSGSDWSRALAPPKDPARAAVVTGALADDDLAALGASAWGDAVRRSAFEVSGHHEAVGALALSLAVSLIVSGDVDEALAVNGRGGTWVTRFARWEQPA